MIKIKVIDIKDKDYPTILRFIKNPPQKLYTLGNIELLNEFNIAIVGSRTCSEYGIRTATKFARELSGLGVNIVSGLAVGIDAAAHNGALEYSNRTIAVLPCGFNNIFPEENIGLYEQILQKNGCVITEYPPEKYAEYDTFVQRNRIVSGISQGTLVIEAGVRSGTGITAQFTIDQNKKLFCIPNSIENKYSIGTNNLIQKGAKLTTNVQDIIREYEAFKNKKIIKQSYKTINVKKEYKYVYDQISDLPIHINELCKKLNTNISDINFILTMLELDGLIKKLPGDRYILNA